MLTKKTFLNTNFLKKLMVILFINSRGTFDDKKGAYCTQWVRKSLLFSDAINYPIFYRKIHLYETRCLSKAQLAHAFAHAGARGNPISRGRLNSEFIFPYLTTQAGTIAGRP